GDLCPRGQRPQIRSSGAGNRAADHYRHRPSPFMSFLDLCPPPTRVLPTREASGREKRSFFTLSKRKGLGWTRPACAQIAEYLLEITGQVLLEARPEQHLYACLRHRTTSSDPGSERGAFRRSTPLLTSQAES